MGRVLLLEPFDLPEEELQGPSHSADWIAGHAEGVSAGVALARAKDAQLSNEIAQTVADLAFTYAEARTQVLISLEPLFRAILDRLLPDLIKLALMPHILEQMIDAARIDSIKPMRLSVSPETCRALSRAFSGALPLPLKIAADPSLGPGVAVLSHVGQETALDLDGLLGGVGAVLSALFDETEQRNSHG